MRLGQDLETNYVMEKAQEQERLRAEVLAVA
jgi:hypothetical protein